MIAAIAVAAYILLLFAIIKRDAQQDAAGDADTADAADDVFTDAEQAKMVYEQIVILDDLQDLLTEIQATTPDRVLVVHLGWMCGQKSCTYDLFLDGENVATVAMLRVIRREIEEQRDRVALHSNALRYRLRSVKNGTKNDDQTLW